MSIFVYADDSPSSSTRDPSKFLLLSRPRIEGRKELYLFDSNLPEIMDGRDSCYVEKSAFRQDLKALHRSYLERSLETLKALDALF